MQIHHRRPSGATPRRHVMFTPWAFHHGVQRRLFRLVQRCLGILGAIFAAEFLWQRHQLVEPARQVVPEFALAADHKELRHRLGLEAFGGAAFAKAQRPHGGRASGVDGRADGATSGVVPWPEKRAFGQRMM